MLRRETDQAISEHELISRCKRGDPAAQHALYERTCERVYRLLLRMTHSREHAEDLAQDTYLKAFAAVATFDERSSLNTWLYRIAVNEVLQWSRRKKPALLDPEVAAARPEPPAGHDAGTRLDVAGAMAALDPADRAMLLLRYQEGLDYRAIAEVTDIAMGTVASRLSRARERLRGLLQDFAPPGEESDRNPHPMSQGRERAARIAASLKERAS